MNNISRIFLMIFGGEKKKEGEEGKEEGEKRRGGGEKPLEPLGTNPI